MQVAKNRDAAPIHTGARCNDARAARGMAHLGPFHHLVQIRLVLLVFVVVHGHVIIVGLIEVKRLLILLHREHEGRALQFEAFLSKHLLGNVEYCVDSCIVLKAIQAFLLVLARRNNHWNVDGVREGIQVAVDLSRALHVAADGRLHLWISDPNHDLKV